MSVTYRVSFEKDRKFLSYLTPLYNVRNVTFDDELLICVTKIGEIVDLSEPMDSDYNAEIDNETLIKTVTFSNALHCLETVKTHLMQHKEGEKDFGEINKFSKKKSIVCNKGMERLRKSWKTVLLSLLSLAFVIKPQVRSLQIRPQTCYNSMGDVGTCMFVWECIKTEGKHLGTCADGFLFGSCCAHSDSKNNLIPQTSTTTTSIHPSKSTTISLSFSSASESEDLDNFKTTFKPGLLESTTAKPSHMKPTIFTTQSRPQYFKPVPLSKPSTPKTSQRPTFKPSPTSSKPGTHLISKPSLVTIENFLTLPTTPSLEIIPKPSSSAVNNGQYNTLFIFIKILSQGSGAHKGGVLGVRTPP
ncbi:uncharacterized protein TNCV_4539671 [Trichonephila clavipes]|nr:uncharacterized protein TNCV_4539671 [Trichonephila clavipes]